MKSIPSPISAQLQNARRLVFMLFLLISLGGGTCRRGEKMPDPPPAEYRDTVRAFYVGLAALRGRRGCSRQGRADESRPTRAGQAPMWANLGLLSLKQREFDLAAQRFEKARSLVPEATRIIVSQATLANNRGNPSEATVLLRRAVEVDSRNLKAFYSLSQEVERQGSEANDAEAQRLMEKILAVQPENLVALLDATRLAAKRGD